MDLMEANRIGVPVKWAATKPYSRGSDLIKLLLVSGFETPEALFAVLAMI